MNSKREVWIDYIKAFACILVVLGHFFQSMVKASVLPDNSLYQWFNTTIYYFHVPLFFICSGYLYQRYSRVDSFPFWVRNVLKKSIVLGIPYFEFSLAIWLLKTVFSGEINDQIGSLGFVLFIHPIPPYWYLYILFLMFVVTPTVKTTKGIWILSGVAVFSKLMQITWGGGVQRITNLCNSNTSIEPDLVRTRNVDSVWKFAEGTFKGYRSDNWSSVFSY